MSWFCSGQQFQWFTLWPGPGTTVGLFQVVFGTAYMAAHTMYFVLETARITTMNPSPWEPQLRFARGSQANAQRFWALGWQGVPRPNVIQHFPPGFNDKLIYRIVKATLECTINVLLHKNRLLLCLSLHRYCRDYALKLIEMLPYMFSRNMMSSFLLLLW